MVAEDYDGPPLVSIEEESAMEPGLTIGDVLMFEVAGREVEAEIASIRRVNWDSFQPNFFLVFSPGALDDYADDLYLEHAHREGTAADARST